VSASQRAIATIAMLMPRSRPCARGEVAVVR